MNLMHADYTLIALQASIGSFALDEKDVERCLLGFSFRDAGLGALSMACGQSVSLLPAQSWNAAAPVFLCCEPRPSCC